jgi:hypothetical protein
MKAIRPILQFFGVLFVTSWVFSATAQVTDFVPSVKTSSSRIKSLIVETTYLYRVLEVQPPLRLSIDLYPERPDADTKPERVLQEQFAAMKQGNYERFMSTWTLASQKEIDARNASNLNVA